MTSYSSIDLLVFVFVLNLQMGVFKRPVTFFLREITGRGAIARSNFINSVFLGFFVVAVCFVLSAQTAAAQREASRVKKSLVKRGETPAVAVAEPKRFQMVSNVEGLEIFPEGRHSLAGGGSGEVQSTLVPPGKKDACPDGRLLISDDKVKSPARVYRFDLDKIGSGNAFATPQTLPDASTDVIASNDHDLVTLTNGDVLLLKMGRSIAELEDKPDWFDFTYKIKESGTWGPGARSVMYIWRSEDCGQSFSLRSSIDTTLMNDGYGYGLYLVDAAGNYSPLQKIAPMEANGKGVIFHLAAIDLGIGPVLIYWYDINAANRKMQVRGRLITADYSYTSDFPVSLVFEAPAAAPSPWFGDYHMAGGFARGLRQAAPVGQRRFASTVSPTFEYYPVWKQPDGDIHFSRITYTKPPKPLAFGHHSLTLVPKPTIPVAPQNIRQLPSADYEREEQ